MHSEYGTFDSLLICPCCGEKVNGEAEQCYGFNDTWLVKLSCLKCGIFVNSKKNISILNASTEATKKFIKIANKKSKKSLDKSLFFVFL